MGSAAMLFISSIVIDGVSHLAKELHLAHVRAEEQIRSALCAVDVFVEWTIVPDATVMTLIHRVLLRSSKMTIAAIEPVSPRSNGERQS